MKVRFLADANLDRQITEGLCRREPSIDFLSADAAVFREKMTWKSWKLLQHKGDSSSLTIKGPCPRRLENFSQIATVLEF
jgi:hypothetical protein